jgi:HSP20 family protein
MNTQNGISQVKNGHAVITAPPVDVYENEDELLVTVDVPGAAPDSVQVQLEKNRLSISARAAAGTDREGTTSWRPRDYQRTFVVPDGIDAEAITAELSQGVLRVRLPKRAERKARVIPVRPAS